MRIIPVVCVIAGAVWFAALLRNRNGSSSQLILSALVLGIFLGGALRAFAALSLWICWGGFVWFLFQGASSRENNT